MGNYLAILTTDFLSPVDDSFGGKKTSHHKANVVIYELLITINI
jgi:hypothetical protein